MSNDARGALANLKEEKRTGSAFRRGAKMNIGSVSLVVIFVTLCLSVFSVLAFSSARAEKALAERSAEAIREYYAAELILAEKAGALEEAAFFGANEEELILLAEEMGFSAEKTAEGLLIEGDSAVDESRKICAKLLIVPGESFRIIRWQEVFAEEWTPDDDLNVWDGGF
ncbi:MAG: hypothetical protein IJC39_00865 [Firmicutes bacterium]|nr:hypothetical protein [Bacillota bacterium]